MKAKINKVFTALLLSAALLVSGVVPNANMVVHASGTEVSDAKNSMDKLKDAFKAAGSDFKGALAGSMGAVVNDENWFEGFMLGNLLNLDNEYYDQPTKIFDKVNNVYKDTSSSTALPNCTYSYEGGDDYSSTSNYQIFQDNSDHSTQTYNYQWYNPITQNYNYTDYFMYDYDYNTYYYQTTTNNFQYDYYYIDNSTYVTYYIVETDTTTGTENEYQYDVYYQLPDGRNSYDLEKDDVWGTYFIYDVVNYESVAEDDGTTLGLWHFDGNTNDSSYWNNNAGTTANIQYSTGVFGNGKYLPEDMSVTLMLYLGKSSFDSSEAFTLEWIEYNPAYSVTGYDKVKISNCLLMPGDKMYDNAIQFNTWVHYALVFDGSDYTLFVNGVKRDISSSTSSYHGTSLFYCGFDITDSYIMINPHDYISSYNSSSTSSSWHYELRNHYGSTIDEMRLSKGVLYESNYVPSAEPFTTNNVLVLPDKIKDSDILLFSNYETPDFRIGGARQTYPTNGSVYVALDDDDIVTSVQQYQVNQWVEVEARVYVDGKTQTLRGYDMAEFKLTEVTAPGEDSDSDDSGDSSGDGSGSSGSGSDDSEDSSGGGFDSLIDAFKGFFDTIMELCVNLIDMVSDLITSIFDTLTLFTDFSSGFSDFLSATFSFVPSEVWSLVGAGITLTILLGFVKWLRG